ncbi:MAG: hypothetical protein SOY71_07155, partial [Dialister sp.]|nr:hypothetical protein [Dialister sp.]
MTIQTERSRAQYLCIHRISSFEKGNDVGFRVQGSGLAPGAAHFVILSGEKRRMLANGLSETGELRRRI